MPCRAGHTKAPEGTGGSPAVQRVQWLRTSPQSLVAAGSLARWPCGPRTRFPGPSRGSLLGPVWRFTSAPSGKTKCTVRGHTSTTGLSTNLLVTRPTLSPKFADVVDELWILIGEVAAHGPSARASRRHERSLGTAVRRLQPPLADGAVPADRPGQGPAERPLARPSAPRGRDRHPDRPARGHGHPGPPRPAGRRRHRARGDDRHDPPRRAHRPRRLHDHGRHGPHPGHDCTRP